MKFWGENCSFWQWTLIVEFEPGELHGKDSTNYQEMYFSQIYIASATALILSVLRPLFLKDLTQSFLLTVDIKTHIEYMLVLF